MIIVKIELMSGITGHLREIGRMYLCNTETTSVETKGKLGDYAVAVCKRGTVKIPAPVDPVGSHPTRAGRVFNYPRDSYNVWRLISRALHSCFPEERHPQSKPIISPAVLEGLRELIPSVYKEWSPNVTAAVEWLNAANPESYE